MIEKVFIDQHNKGTGTTRMHVQKIDVESSRTSSPLSQECWYLHVDHAVDGPPCYVLTIDQNLNSLALVM